MTMPSSTTSGCVTPTMDRGPRTTMLDVPPGAEEDWMSAPESRPWSAPARSVGPATSMKAELSTTCTGIVARATRRTLDTRDVAGIVRSTCVFLGVGAVVVGGGPGEGFSLGPTDVAFHGDKAGKRKQRTIDHPVSSMGPRLVFEH